MAPKKRKAAAAKAREEEEEDFENDEEVAPKARGGRKKKEAQAQTAPSNNVYTHYRDSSVGCALKETLDEMGPQVPDGIAKLILASFDKSFKRRISEESNEIKFKVQFHASPFPLCSKISVLPGQIGGVQARR